MKVKKKENYLMLPYSAQAFALNIHKNRSKKIMLAQTKNSSMVSKGLFRN